MTKSSPSKTGSQKDNIQPQSPPTRAYTLVQVDGNNWYIEEITFQNGKVIKSVRDVESTKQIKANKLTDLLMSGRTLSELVPITA